MKLWLLAIGTRLPGWANAAFAEFAQRMPRELSVELKEIRAAPRSEGKPVDALLALEAERLRAALPARCRLVVLDERGADLTTRQLCARLGQWMGEGHDVALVIGGPDGLAPDFKEQADEALRLSSLTLPHALARVVLAEALYRAASLLKNHPYHRE